MVPPITELPSSIYPKHVIQFHSKIIKLDSVNLISSFALVLKCLGCPRSIRFTGKRWSSRSKGKVKWGCFTCVLLPFHNGNVSQHGWFIVIYATSLLSGDYLSVPIGTGGRGTSFCLLMRAEMCNGNPARCLWLYAFGRSRCHLCSALSIILLACMFKIKWLLNFI